MQVNWWFLIAMAGFALSHIICGLGERSRGRLLAGVGFLAVVPMAFARGEPTPAMWVWIVVSFGLIVGGVTMHVIEGRRRRAT